VSGAVQRRCEEGMGREWQKRSITVDAVLLAFPLHFGGV
jgi:hypothetical protein